MSTLPTVVPLDFSVLTPPHTWVIPQSWVYKCKHTQTVMPRDKDHKASLLEADPGHEEKAKSFYDTMARSDARDPFPPRKCLDETYIIELTK